MATLVNVWIEGTYALLMCRFGDAAAESVQRGARRVQIQEELPRDVAERCVYRDKAGAMCWPGASIARLLRDAGANHKQRGSRRAIKYIVPAAVVVVEEHFPLYLVDRATRAKDFEVDSRRCVIHATKGSVMRHRARIEKWSARLTLRVNENVLPADMIRQLLVEGGAQIGIGDFRPEKGGPFGTFDLVSWDDAGKLGHVAAAE